ncbi:conjugative transposon protein TraM [Bacteroides sp. 51]|uniref:conjugative transposon protein TraM n=1 Tax=Bacteroides sp. 51 TaxID=2302938 RepID=UPI0013D239FC|nr:conjugative transposon protein TraM [Bacteroides sp. 51]NDV83440.1 conjugative transposon protein TraM [Bacteroides sp. 51]
MKKKKIFLLGGLVLCAAFLLLSITLDGSSSDDSSREISLRAETKDVSLDDMLKLAKGRNHNTTDENASGLTGIHSSAPSASADNPEAIARIQQLIRENTEGIHSGIQEIENERQGIITYTDERDQYSTIQGSSTATKNTPLKSQPKKESNTKKTKPKEESVEKPEKPKRSPFNSVNFGNPDDKNAIKAYVHSEQTVMIGSTLKMRLGEDAYTDDGVMVKKNSPIFGTVTSVDGERVNVKITHINHQGNILPFQKEVYSKDALLGIYVPGNPKSDAVKDATGGALDGLPVSGIPGVDVATQIAGAVASSAAQAGKQAASKNVKKIKVTIKTNYEIYLRPDEKKK